MQLVEPEVRVLSRPKDLSLAEKAVEGAKEQYVSITGRDVSTSVVGELSDNMYVACSALTFRLPINPS